MIGPGHRGLVHARAGHEAVGEARVEPRMGAGGDADERIGGAHARRERLAARVGFETIAQEAGVALVDVFQPGDRGGLHPSKASVAIRCGDRMVGGVGMGAQLRPRQSAAPCRRNGGGARQPRFAASLAARWMAARMRT